MGKKRKFVKHVVEAAVLVLNSETAISAIIETGIEESGKKGLGKIRKAIIQCEIPNLCCYTAIGAVIAASTVALTSVVPVGLAAFCANIIYEAAPEKMLAISIAKLATKAYRVYNKDENQPNSYNCIFYSTIAALSLTLAPELITAVTANIIVAGALGVFADKLQKLAQDTQNGDISTAKLSCYAALASFTSLGVMSLTRPTAIFHFVPKLVSEYVAPVAVSEFVSKVLESYTDKASEYVKSI